MYSKKHEKFGPREQIVSAASELTKPDTALRGSSNKQETEAAVGPYLSKLEKNLQACKLLINKAFDEKIAQVNSLLQQLHDLFKLHKASVERIHHDEDSLYNRFLSGKSLAIEMQSDKLASRAEFTEQKSWYEANIQMLLQAIETLHLGVSKKLKDFYYDRSDIISVVQAIKCIDQFQKDQLNAINHIDDHIESYWNKYASSIITMSQKFQAHAKTRQNTFETLKKQHDLALAAATGVSCKVSYSISDGAKLNLPSMMDASSEKPRYALDYAIINHHVATVEKLIALGAIEYSDDALELAKQKAEQFFLTPGLALSFYKASAEYYNAQYEAALLAIAKIERLLSTIRPIVADNSEGDCGSSIATKETITRSAVAETTSLDSDSVPTQASPLTVSSRNISDSSISVTPAP